jgi:hypothetical protein
MVLFPCPSTVALPQASTPTVRAQLAPSEFPKPLPPAPRTEPVKEEEKQIRSPELEPADDSAEAEEASEIEARAPVVAVAETVTAAPQTSPAPTAAYSSILGQLTLRRDETLSRIIQRVYGNFNSKHFKSLILANPDIEDPDRVEVGQIISLPAIHVEVNHLDRPVWWVKFDETDQLEDAYNVLRNYPENASKMRLIPHWNPTNGTQFSVVLNKLYSTEQTARDELELMPARLLSNAEVVSSWDRRSVYFADPYFGRKH